MKVPTIAPTWNSINRLGKSRILATAYIWLIIVPILARGLSKVQEPVVLTGLAEGLTLSFTLPFSWKLFYFSAVFISAGGLIYTLFCPKIIRDFEDFGDFQRKGHGVRYIRTNAEQLKINFSEDDVTLLNDPGKAIVDFLNIRMGEMFWTIYETENNWSQRLRTACFTLYSIGLLLFSIVFIQNLWYVVRCS